MALTTIGGAGVIAGTVCCIVGFSTPGNVRTTRYANGGQVTVSGLPAIGIVVNVISVPLLIAGAVLLAKNINYARR